MPQPALFLSHGAPDLAVRPDHPSHIFLREFGHRLSRPDAIVIFTAHWLTETITVSSVQRYETIHDFGNFDPRLFEMKYEPTGNPELAEEIASLLDRSGRPVQIDGERGLDHGAWIPLMLMYPEADIPVVQLSIQPRKSPEYHLRLGEAIGSLRNRNILVVGSGALTHNLSGLRMSGRVENPPPWVTEFSDWMKEAIESGNDHALLRYRTSAPKAEENHPTDEHLLPIFAAMGAAAGSPGLRLHSASMYHTVMMDMYQFG